MSLKKIEQIKNGKWVRVWDLIAYAVLSVAIIVLVIVFTVGRDRSALGGFTVAYGGETVLTYDFSTRDLKVLSADNIAVEEGTDGFTVTFSTNDDKGYNLIVVNTAERTVRVTESNCSVHKDCVYTPALKNNSSAPIICTPHGLSISPLKAVDDGII